MKSKLLDKTACDTMRELARLLNRDAKEQDKTIRALTRLINRLPEFSGSPQISKQISANYIATVADIGGLYK